ncbi:MAG TPA: NFACT family protein [Fimbriimonadaceae bacterium]|nr:NFACT family protein [Fimbriimonadaceae bacterium]
MAIRIPYDSLTLSAVAWELQAFVGGKVQRISQPDEFTVGIGLYGKEAGAGMLLVSCHSQYARAYLTTKRLPNQPQPPTFCATLRSRLEGGFLASVTQVDFDRILELEIEHPSGRYRLIAELMGKHSNIILVDEEKKTVSAAKWVGRTKSSRPIQPGGKYHKPPFQPKPPIFSAQPGDDLKEYTGASPFLVKLIQADPATMERVRALALEGKADPVLCPGEGAYPISVAALGLKEFHRSSVCVALEQHYDAFIPSQEAEALRKSLLGQLQRVIFAREVALKDLEQARTAGNRAGEMQRAAELILAYGPSAPSGAKEMEAFDYDGLPVKITLDPELDFKENANVFFERARKAKARMGVVEDQIARIGAEKAEIESMAASIETAERLKDVEALQEEAKKRHWLHSHRLPTKHKEDRPFEGNRVRELVGPGGWTILYGENAEANDYLVVRVAKPNDWWLHVRGNVSSHVVIVTRNQPEKVGREVMEYAAKIAVQHSAAKHSGYVPVDYTLRKYVRKPRGAAKGTALYTHEKTIHVES